jgi:nucleotide-binding universal stress UspA family protein
MTDSLFSRVLLPVADDEDADATATAALPYVRAVDGDVVAVHVIEKAGGAPDKAGVEQREEFAEEVFEVVRDRFAAEDVAVETRIAYGTDVSETIFDVAREVDASAIVFTPRGGSRWIRLLTGDTALDLITDGDRPVIALPDPDEGGDGDPTGEGA